MKIIIWDLPEKEIAYLKKNCAMQFVTGDICIMGPESAEDIYAEIDRGRLPTKEILIISKNSEILKESTHSGMITIGYLPPQRTGDRRTADNGDEKQEISTSRLAAEPGFPQVDMIVEGFEEVDYDFFEKIYQRHHGLPWKILETERLLVRELALSDVKDLFELYSYEGMTDFMEGLYPYEEEYEYQKAYIENMYYFFGYGMWLVFEKETGKLVGRAGVEHREALEGELELGYAIGTPWQGKGYAMEVCQGILEYVREELGFEEICSLVQPENTASIRLQEKLGFTLETEIILDGISYKKYKKSL
ncbi:MAG: GNAT family N-acetyltransferase [Roseburia sp.]|nr:GNAT family N-acetyltransferase [Roseburia sp.]